jgi:hypothetical protein
MAWVGCVNYSRTDLDQLSKLHSALQDDDPQRGERQSYWSRRRRIARQSAIERQQDLRERDALRGYRINIKQVVLAFVVEFFIIGIVLTGQYLYAAQIHDASRFMIMQTMLYPVALAMVELARVPLALAVRIQKSWNIQLAALLGVACAVVVTSASLYQIGNFTFSPRLQSVHESSNRLAAARERRDEFVVQKRAAQASLDQQNKDWNVLSERYNTLSSQLNSQPGQTCTPTSKTSSDGSQTTTQTCKLNPALKTLQTEISDVKGKLSQAEVVGRQAQAELAKYDERPQNETVSKAEADYRESVYQSPLHSYTAMLFNKDPQDVSEGEVKTLEWYLILIPSIAAALSSTLIAMTAVHRIKTPKIEAPTKMPDEAMTYLLGPLVKTLEQEAKNAVSAAVNAQVNQTKAKPPPEPAKV